MSIARLLQLLDSLRLTEAKWTQAEIDDLPDSAFAWIEPGGEKDSDGKTKPRSLRHLPFKGPDGKVDLPHLRDALGRLKTTKISAEGKAAAGKKLAAAAKEAGVGKAAKKVKEGSLPLFEGAPMSLEDRRNEVREALCDLLNPPEGAPSPNAPRCWYIVATFDDSVIVNVDEELYRYPVSWNDAGDVTLGDPEEVEVTYQAVTEAVRLSSGSGIVLGPILEEAEGGKPGSRWLVACVVEGLSANKVLYSAEVLRAAAPLYEGAKVFWNHVDPDAGGKAPLRDPRDIAGFIRGAQFSTLAAEGATTPGTSAVVGVLHATDPLLRERLLEAHEAGNPDLFGLSHTVFADVEKVKLASGAAYRAKAIKAVESVDVVSFPSAGGRVMRLVAGMASPVALTQEDLVNLEQMLARLKEGAPDLFAALSAQPSEVEVAALIRVMEGRPKPAPAAAPPAPPPAPAPARVSEGSPSPAPAAAQGMSAEEIAELRAMRRERTVDRLLEGRTLLEATRTQVRGTMLALLEAGASDAAVRTYLDGEVSTQARIVEAAGGAIRGAGVGRVQEAAVVQDEVDKTMLALQGFFSGRDEAPLGADGKPDASKRVGRFKSIKEAYIRITGDDHVTGRVSEAKGLARFERITEGLSTGSFGNVLASSLNRQLVREYNADGGAYADNGQGWLWTNVPANDFRNRERVRFGGYGNLPTVSEQGTYQPLTSPTDEKATYSVSKRGGTETITFEMIKNDDVGVVQRIPKRMAMAARRTFYEFVYNLVITNPTIYDSVALFHANHGSNLGASALSKSSFTAARLVMLKQTEKDSAKRVGLLLRHLIVPPDLQDVAYNLFARVAASSGTAFTANMDPEFIATESARPTIHVVTHATDTNDWFACAGIDQTDQIEVGFLDGREDPELFVADLPNAGSLFTADKIDYKLRHIYGGAVLDFRGFFGAFGI